MSSNPSDQRPIDRLLSIMARLRDPDGGCAWDLEQTFATIAPYTVEEAYEVADAIERGDLNDLREELGDLLLQVVFHSRMAQEQGAFAFDDVADAISEKMIRRHPHVFGQDEQRTSAEQTRAWEVIKAQERAKKGKNQSLLDDVPTGLPALTRAVKLTARAARVGFDWPDVSFVLDKLREETAELEHEIAAGRDVARMRDELGDILFVCANLARKLDLEPEDALRSTNAKFVRRFQFSGLLAQLIEHERDVRPVETYTRGPRGQFHRAGEGGQAGRHVVEQALVLALRRALLSLDNLPGAGLLGAGALFVLAEDVRMATDHLLRDSVGHVVEGEGALLLGHAAVENDLQQQVSELLAKV